MKYQAPFGVTDPNASYVNGNPSTGTAGSIPPALAFEEPMRELVAAIVNAGLTPSDSDLAQLWKSLQLSPWLQETANDTGAANAYAAAISSVPPQLYPGMSVRVKIANANTGASTFALNAFGAHAIKKANGAALVSGDLAAGQIAWLIFDGAFWQIANYQGTGGTGTTNNFVLNIAYAVDSGAANALVGTFTPTVTTLAAGEPMLVKVAHTNTGAVTLKADTTATTPVVWPDGTGLAAGDIVAGGIILVVYDGTNFQLMCRINRGAGGGGGSFQIPYAADTGTANALVGAFTPTIASLAAGTCLLMTVGHTNTGATVLTADANASKSLVWPNGNALQAGDILVGELIFCVYDGTHFQLLDRPDRGSIPYAVDSGAVNTLVGAFNPTVPALVAGLMLLVKVGHTNTAGVTLAADATATKNVVWPDGTAIQAGQITANGVILVVYDGTNFQLLCRINGGTSAPTWPAVGSYSFAQINSGWSVSNAPGSTGPGSGLLLWNSDASLGGTLPGTWMATGFCVAIVGFVGGVSPTNVTPNFGMFQRIA